MSTYLGTNFIAGMSPDMTGATASTNGQRGLVPAPAAGAQERFLRSDGTWQDSLEGRISNCITDIPQDIKLGLSNGTLTLKAGSKVYVPNGAGNFDLITIASDVNLKRGYSQTELVCYDADRNTLQAEKVSASYSGTTAPTSDKYMFWYDTGSNKIRWSRDYGASWDNYAVSLPIAIATTDSTGYVSIDQVFNGFGYIGSTVYALPNVKGLIPNGNNEDGTLANREFTTSTVLTYTNTYSHTGYLYILVDSNDLACRMTLRATHALCGSVFYSGGTVTRFSPKAVFHALDWSDSATVAGWSLPSSTYIDLTLGTSGTSYTAPANGWVVFRRRSSAAANCVEVAVRGGTTDSHVSSRMFATAASQLQAVYLPVTKGRTFTVNYDGTNATDQVFRFVYAVGEV